MRILLAGGSGFLGTHLRHALAADGHDVRRLVRGAAAGPDEVSWDPYGGRLDQAEVDAADVVINLAGSPTAGNPHSARWASQLRESRVTTTRVLAEAIARCEPGSDGRLPAFLAGNGISFYGDHGEQVLTEASDSRGSALLTQVTRDWQAAADPAAAAGARVAILRTAPVMDRRSAPLKQLLVPFRLGLGATLGSGRQRMPMISLRDWVGAVVFLAASPGAQSLSGPFNLCCEQQPTNAEFTDALARLVGRPRFLKVPGVLLRRGAGAMAPELLGSLNVRPQALLNAGFTFADPDVSRVLAAALS